MSVHAWCRDQNSPADEGGAEPKDPTVAGSGPRQPGQAVRQARQADCAGCRRSFLSQRA